MITLTFIAFLGLAMTVALVDWRRAWVLAVFIGVLQDPARKLTPGTPVMMSLSIVIVYFMILISAQKTLQQNLRDFTKRFANIYLAAALFFLFLIVAALNGVATFGLEYWKIPALSLFIYLAPMPAVLMGYAFVDREERLIGFFKMYAAITAVALIGTPLEYFRVHWRALGIVNLPQGFIRFLPGMEIRMLAGFYRGPDIMGWHAATLTMICIAMAMLRGTLMKSWPWIALAAWGFGNTILSGRRKCMYMVAVFAVMLVWRYIQRLTVAQLVTFVFVGVAIGVVVQKIGEGEESNVYTRSALTTTNEIFERLEGGFRGTIVQTGFLGAGLGVATQGTYHLAPSKIAEMGSDFGWQEGGLGKLTVEMGMPGVIAAGLLIVYLMRMMLFITRQPDEPASTQIIRVALFGLVIANVINFLVSAQAYSDAVLTLMSAFFVGALLGTAALEDRAALAAATASAQATPALVPARA